MDKTIKEIGKRAGISPEAVEISLGAFVAKMQEEIFKSGEFMITDFGKFVIKKCKARKGRISKRGKIAIKPQEIIIPPYNKLKFIPCERLKKMINP